MPHDRRQADRPGRPDQEHHPINPTLAPGPLHCHLVSPSFTGKGMPRDSSSIQVLDSLALENPQCHQLRLCSQPESHLLERLWLAIGFHPAPSLFSPRYLSLFDIIRISHLSPCCTLVCASLSPKLRIIRTVLLAVTFMFSAPHTEGLVLKKEESC